MDQLRGHLERLVEGSGAQAAVIWTRSGPTATGSVVCAYPEHVLPAGTAWPEIGPVASGVIHRDRATLTSLVPTTLRLELSAAPTAALSTPLAQPGLSLLLVWCGSTVPQELPEDLDRLIDQQIARRAQMVEDERRSDQDAQRLAAVVGSLQQGVVSVDRTRGRADINPAAAALLGLPTGDVAASEFAAAMRDLASRALDRSEAASMRAGLLGDAEASINCALRFDRQPTHLKVFSRAFRAGTISGRVWVFDDVSEVAAALEAVESARALLRANVDSVLDPQVLLEAMRDSAGRIVDFAYREVNQATCDDLGLSREDLLGRGMVETMPEMQETELLAGYIRCLDTGEPQVLDDFSYDNAIVDDTRRYDIRATRASPTFITLTWRDVTDRLRNAELLAASETKYRLLIENAGTVFSHTRKDPEDGEHKIVWVSPNLEAVLGAPVESVIGRSVSEMGLPEDRIPNEARWRKVGEGGTVQDRVRIETPDGVVHWCFVHIKPIYDAEGHRDGEVGSMRIIDDEVAAEQAAGEAQRLQARADQLYRRSVDGAAAGICLADLAGNFVEVNASICDFFGYDQATLRQKTWQELTAPDYLEADLTNRDEMLAGVRDTYRMAKQFIHADGHLIWGDLSVSCLRAADGQVETFVAQITDITAEITSREQLEQARIEQAASDARYRRSIDNAAVGMCTVNLGGRLDDVNDAMCQFFGYDAEAMNGKPWQDFTVPEHLGAELDYFNAVLDGGTDSYRSVKAYTHADGHPIWGQLSISVVAGNNGEPEYMVVLVTDITAQVNADENNRTLAKELQRQTDILKSELVSAASYMTSIMPTGLHGAVAVSSRYLPSRELGGDIYDYRWVDDDHLIAYLIDVSGHGIRPALLAASLQNILRSGTFTTQTLLLPAAVLTELNRLFQMEQQGDHYFTIWYGVYERSTRTLRYANAGAPPAYTFNDTTTNGFTTTELGPTSRPVGLYDDTEFIADSYSVPDKCQILIYSDGASELQPLGGEPISLSGFTELAIQVAKSPNWSLGDLVERLRELSPISAFEDDLSLIRMVFD